MYKFFKRFFDIAASLAAIVVLSPLMLVTAVAVKLDSKGPVIFKQERLGLKGKVFNIYKFRSMCCGAEHMGTGVYSGVDDVRVTRVGRILRKTSIDELPQLVNILKGEMSFIGPRPPLTYHPWDISEYTPEQMKMFDVRPGITGWCSVVALLKELKNQLDIKILLVTVLKVLKNEDNANVRETVASVADEQADE